ncbi:uncharacterized protein LOC112577034 [Pomacea canaliculata]|nr:uncharacterized protein LOC112577034 [Pomacea canaliculata]XP_025115736.1 uncharacterized protein LOC112577034 [Pomacea canaliculata]
MLRTVSHLILVAMSSAVVVPYAITILSHLMYSHQPLRQAAARSLHPRRVYAFSLVLLQKMVLYLRYSPLYLRWRYYYINADPAILIKNIAYGRNNCSLDLHLPEPRHTVVLQKKAVLKPVVVFLFGGAWSSGDKSMYGALCYQLANRLDSLICCPNYSLYPQGCVDDMIQDIVDCVQWIYDNIHSYGGQKEKLMIVGHSAGAHLGALAILELLHEERTQNSSVLSPDLLPSLCFHEGHYTSAAPIVGNHEDSSESSESFAVVSENGNSESVALIMGTSGALSSSLTHELEASASAAGQEALVCSEGLDTSAVDVFDVTTNSGVPERMEPSFIISGLEASGMETYEPGKGLTELVQEIQVKVRRSGGPGDVVEISKIISQEVSTATGENESCDEEDDDNDSIITVRPKDIERHATLSDLCGCIKAFVGLAGVYHIGDHYSHESFRGIEDISSMTPAMYGHDHFERFSPTTMLMSLTAPISLPCMVLVHGTADRVVPIKSSEKMATALSRIGTNVSLQVLPNCDHYDICFDLMLPSRQFHNTLMTILMETASSVF